MTNQGLGRGLSSLIPQKVNKVNNSINEDKIIVNTTSNDERGRVLELAPDIIKVNSLQPRKTFSDFNLDELKESIKEYGVIQPLIVTNRGGQYELIAGERRLRASKAIGLKTVPVVIRKVDEQEKLGVALVENLQRQDLNSIEMALAYQKLMDEFNLSTEDVAKKVGKARASISNTIRMLNLPDEIQAAMIEGRIGEGHAKYLLGIESFEKQMTLFRKILNNNLTVSDTSKEARHLGGTKHAKIKINYKDKDKEFAFREFFGTKVEVRRNKKREALHITRSYMVVSP